MIVMKFGGTSVENERAIRRVGEIVRGRLKQKPVVVVSAMAGVTDALVAMSKSASRGSLPQAFKLLRQVKQRHLTAAAELVGAKESASLKEFIQSQCDALQEVLRGVAALGELSPRTTDNILSFGEVMSSHMVAAAFAGMGMNSVAVDSRKCVVTDAGHTRAVPQMEDTADRLRAQVRPLLAAGKVAVMGGFIGATPLGVTTTLGRGGSDFSAAIVGACLQARRIEIWTDVDGMMTTDPRICPDAQKIDVIAFEEASELAYFGAKVLHPATLIPAVEKDIPVYILNSRNPRNKGTCVRRHAKSGANCFRAIAMRKGAQVISVRSPRMLMAHGFLRALFEAFDRHECVADLVSTSEVSVSVTLDGARDVSRLVKDLEKLGEVSVERNKAIICLVGEDISGRVGIAAEVFGVMARAKVNLHMISQGASEINISFVIEERDAVTAVKALHQHFFEQKHSVRRTESISSEQVLPISSGSALQAGVA